MPGPQEAQTLRPAKDVLQALPGFKVEVWENEARRVF